MQSELRRIAGRYMRSERPDHTLQPTALVGELVVRLLEGQPVAWTDRTHFLAVASQQMRRILVDHARAHLAEKRGGEFSKQTLGENAAVAVPLEEWILDLHAALDELSRLDPRAAKVIELRYFGGMSEEETAEALGSSISTVKRDWAAGRAWLVSRLTG